MHDHLKTVVITGATGGIGLAIAQSFINAGYYVIGLSRSTNKSFNQLGKNAQWIKCDVTKFRDVKNVFARIGKQNDIDVLINATGHSKWRKLENLDPNFIEDMLAVNLKSIFYTTQAALSVFAKKASIVNIASLAGKRGSAHNSVYCAAKFAVVGVTQSLAKELGPRGIRVNGVCPVYVVTDGVLQALKEKVSPAAGKPIATYLKDFAQTQSALKRLPSAQEVASVCLFLASEAAAAITGQNINIDCGVLPQ